MQCIAGCNRGCGAHRTRQTISLLLVLQETLTKWRSYNLHWLSTLSTRMHLSFWFLYPNLSKFQTKESADHWHCRCHRHHLLGQCHSPSLLGKGKSSMPIKKINTNQTLHLSNYKNKPLASRLVLSILSTVVLQERGDLMAAWWHMKMSTHSFPAISLEKQHKIGLLCCLTSQGILIFRNKCYLQSQAFFLQYAKVYNVLKTWNHL